MSPPCDPLCQVHTLLPERNGCGTLTDAELNKMLERITRAAAALPEGHVLRSGGSDRALLVALPELLELRDQRAKIWSDAARGASVLIAWLRHEARAYEALAAKQTLEREKVTGLAFAEVCACLANDLAFASGVCEAPTREDDPPLGSAGLPAVRRVGDLFQHDGGGVGLVIELWDEGRRHTMLSVQAGSRATGQCDALTRENGWRFVRHAPELLPGKADG